MKSAIFFTLLVAAMCVLGTHAADNILKDPPAGPFPGSSPAVPHVTFSGYEPKWSRLDRVGGADGNLRWIRISGCGFRTYAEAVCVWDFKFTSTHAFIADDNTIICELPELDRTHFKTLPQNSRLDVIFDGDQQDRLHFVGSFRWGPQIDCKTPLSPDNGPAVGSTQVTIKGEGFADTKLENLKVFFDDMPATSASAVDDNTIVASVPDSNEIHRDALVSITWQTSDDWWERGSIECYLHSHDYFHYGPIIDDVVGCGKQRNNNGNTVTIQGKNFVDGLFAATVAPEGNSARNNVLLEVTIAGLTVDVDQSVPTFGNRNGNRYQLTASSVSASSISFQPPNPFTDSGDLAAAMGQVATVDIFYRQTKRWVSIGQATFVYGPVLYTLSDDHWHHGGNDQITIQGCGFDSAMTASTVDVRVASLPACAANSLSVSTSANTIACRTRYQPTLCTDSDGSSYDVDVEFTPESESPQFWSQTTYTLQIGSGETTDIGPRFATGALATTRHTVKNSIITVSGSNFLFSNPSNSSGCTVGSANEVSGQCVSTGWTSLIVDGTTSVATNLDGTRDLFDFTLLNNDAVKVGYRLASMDDNTMVINAGTSVFGETAVLSFNFVRNSDNECDYINPHTHVFGPQCWGVGQESTTALWTSGPLSGRDTVAVFLSDFNAYSDSTVRMCQRDHEGNSGREVWPATLQRPGALTTRNPCAHNTSATIEGTYERYRDVTRSSGATTSVSRYTFETGPYATQLDRFRGRRVWGSDYDVVIFLNSVQRGFVDSSTSLDSSFEESFPSCVDWSSSGENPDRGSGGQLVDGDNNDPCTTSTSLECGTYRFGPVVNDISPCKGPMGPRGDPITAVTLSGTDFNDDWSNAIGSDGPIVSFGTLIGDSASVGGGSAIGVSTVWGEPSQRQATVTVFFNTCNMTHVPDKKVHWGPVFDVHPITSDLHTPLAVATKGDTHDLFGFYPVPEMSDSAPNQIKLTGIGFREFCSVGRTGTCSDYAARCIIDGVHTEASVTTGTGGDDNPGITCELPGRPFGTAASVCVEFGTAPCNDNTDPWINNENEIDWTRTLCVEDQQIWYTPLITSFTPTEARTSGWSSDGSGDVDLTITGEGFTRWNYYAEPEVRVGQYAAGSSSVDDGQTISAIVPRYRAEFNTEASVHVYFKTAQVADTTLFEGCALNAEHWKAWAPDTFHFGPRCLLVQTQGGATHASTHLRGGEDEGSTRFFLAGRFLRDCTDGGDSCGVSASNTARCLTPQHSDSLRWPYEGGRGSRTCLHRRATVSMDWVAWDGTSRTIDDVHVHNDTRADLNTDARFEIELPTPDDIECGYGVFTMHFYDALVTDPVQRDVVCQQDGASAPFRLEYGPRYDTFLQEFKLDNIAYGWSDLGLSSVPEDWMVTVIGTRFDDPFFTADGASWDMQLLVGNEAATLGAAGSTSVEFDVPAKTWQSEHSMDVAFVESGESNICEQTIGRFHYGPIILRSSLDGCTSPLGLNVTTTESVGVTGHALQCCGYASAATYGGTPHRCYLRNDQPQSGSFVPVSQGGDLVTCNVPKNVRRPAEWLVNFGLVFGVEDDGEYCDAGECRVTDGPTNNNSPADHRHTLVGRSSAAGTALNICFGPKLTPKEFRVRYSGIEADEEESVQDDEDQVELFSWTLVGTPDTRITKDIVSVACHYDGDEAIGEADLTALTSGGTIECPSRLWHAVCGQPDESLHLVFTMDIGDNAEFTYIVRDYDVPVSTSAGPRFEAENGDIVAATVKYGPYIDTGVTTAEEGTGTDLWDGEYQSAGTGPLDTFAFWTTNNDEHGYFVRTQVELVLDFIAYDGTPDRNLEMWGTEKAMCLFGRDSNGRMRRQKELGVAVERAITYPSLVVSGSAATVDCPVPDGNMGEGGDIWVLLDPHADAYTRLYAPGDTDPASRALGKYWRWTPFAASLSNTWSAPEGLEPVTVYGGGFCGYDRVYCRFAVGGSSIDAVQGDVIDDTMVVCQAPPNDVPASGSVELYFDSATCDGFGCDATADFASVDSYQFAGVTDAWPRHGPVQGQTIVYFEHIGLDNFDSLQCVWHVDGSTQSVSLLPSVPVAANDTVPAPAGSYSCVSPSAGEVQLAQVEIIGYYNNFALANSSSSYLYSRNLGCVWFDYGLPSIDSIVPHAIEWQRSDTVTVTGSYFNGGASNETGTFECWWQRGQVPSSDQPRDLGAQPSFGSSQTVATVADKVEFVQSRNSRQFNSYRLLCATPADRLAVIGAYPFEVVFDDFRTSDNFDFDVTQRSDRVLRAYQTGHEVDVNGTPEPVVGEIGGVLITIEGENIGGGRAAGAAGRLSSYLCRFDSSLVNDDPNLYSVGTYDADTDSVVCIAPPRNLTDFFDDDDETPVAIAVAISLDSGYTWTSDLDVLYVRDERAGCLTDSPASTLSAVAALALATIALFAALF